MTNATSLIDRDGRPFWDALEVGRLVVPTCRACKQAFFPPMPACPRCASTDVVLVDSSGAGSVYSWVTVRIALDPAFADDVPYSVVAVNLADGPRVLGRFLGPSELLEPGLPVQAADCRFHGLAVPGFAPAA